MRILKCFVGVALFVILFNGSNKAEITGIVLDNFGKPIEGAVVKIENTTFTATTNKAGKYHIGYVPGKVGLVVEKGGYASANLQLDIAVATLFPASNLTLYKSLPGGGVYLVKDGDYAPLPEISIAYTHQASGNYYGFPAEIYKECRLEKNSAEIAQEYYLNGEFTIATVGNTGHGGLYRLLDSNGLVWSERVSQGKGREIQAGDRYDFRPISTPVGTFIKLELPENKYVLILRDLYDLTSSVVAPGYFINTESLEKTILELMTVLNDSDFNVHNQAAEALGKIGPIAIPELLKALNDSNAKVRWGAVRALGKIGPKAKSAVPALIKVLSDSDADVRMQGAIALSNVGPEAKSAIPELIKLLSDPDVIDVRRLAAEALGKIGPKTKSAVPDLIKALSDDNMNMRKYAALALGGIGPEAKSAVPALTKVLSDSDFQLRMYSASALGNIGVEAKSAVPELTKALSDSDAIVCRLATEALGKIGPEAKSAVPTLTKVLSDSDWGLRMLSASALGNMGVEAKSAVPELTKALSDDNMEVRKSAAEALRKISLVNK